MVMDDRQLTISHISTGISCERVESIPHTELGMSKVSAWWVPHLLMPDQKRENLDCSEADPANFIERFLTKDEC